MNEKDKEVIDALKGRYEGKMKVMELRGVDDSFEAGVRHFSFDCIDQEDQNVGVHAYYNAETNEVFEIYESVGENCGWKPGPEAIVATE